MGIAILAGCGETSISAALPAARVEAVAGGALSGPAGVALPEPVAVQVFGSDNQPLAGVPVAFVAAQGGSVNPATATTDEDGVARTRWTLGRTAGANVLTATAGTAATTITATATAARAATVTLVSGDNQTAPAGSAVLTAPSVRVADAFGNLVQGAVVTFSVLSGGGRVTDGVRQTNAQGIAAVGSWVLGPSAGAQSLLARVEESGVTNNPIVFNATASPPTGAQMVITAGNNQSAPVGRLVPIAPTVMVRNAAGAGVAGVVVNFAVASGGGSVIGSRQVTDATGTAAVGGWILGDLPGTNTLTASAQGIADVTFTATGVAGAPATMTAVSQTTQAAPAGALVSDPPSVVVRDAQGIPVAGVVVTFSVSAGGGSVNGSPDTTNANGIASVTSWRLGTQTGTNTVTATANNLNSVTFNAVGTAGTAASVVAQAGNNQAAVTGTNVAVQPTVLVTDASGNPVIGATVTFAVISGGGTATGLNQTTDAQGLASVGSWTLGSASPNTLRATVSGSGITGNPVNFTAQSATAIAIVTAPNNVNLGSNFTITVELRNAVGDDVSLAGVPLTIAIANGTGPLNGTLTRNTDNNGRVSFTGLSIPNASGMGVRTFTISGAGLTSVTTGNINFN
jgi:adhesin/invasin